MNTTPIPVTVTAGIVAVSGTNSEVRKAPDVPEANPLFFSHSGAGTRTVLTDANPASVAVVQSESRWRDYVVHRLAQLRRGEGDFTGLTQPSDRVIARARAIADVLFQDDTPTPSVVPSEDGNVSFVWRKAGWKVEIEVGSKEVSVWARERSSGTLLSGSLGELRTEVSDLLSILASRPT